MKKIVLSLTAIMITMSVLCGCSQNNNGNAIETEDGVKVPIAQIYDGFEELQGKDLGVIKLPDKIDKPQYEKLYRFPDRRGGADIPNEKETTLAVLKSCFGESFNESGLTESENWDGSKSYLYSASEDVSAVIVHGFPTAINKSEVGDMLSIGGALLNAYAPSDTDKTVELKNGSCTVGELLGGMQRRLDAEILPYAAGFEAFPMSIRNYKSTDGTSYAEIEYGIRYRGIALEDSSPMFIVQRRAGYSVVTTYSPSSLSIVATDKDDYIIFTATFSDQHPLTEEIGELISLKGAVGLLENELAQNSRYEIELAELRYCCKITAPTLTVTDKEEDQRILADYGEIQTAYFEPTWCFYYSESDASGVQRNALKVNAVTGEITVDK